MACSQYKEKIKRTITPLVVKVKFLTDCDPGRGKPVFKKGSVHGLVISSANHWITRRKAERYVESMKRDKPKKEYGLMVEKPVKKGRRPKKAKVKPEPIVEPVVEETTGDEGVGKESLDEKPAIEEKKSEDGTSFGGMGGLMV